MLTVASCASETLSPFGYFFSSSSARTVRPASVVVAAMSSTIVRKLRRGLPRQLMLMKEKSRCSILFHLLVPGGKWHTVIGNFSSFEKLAMNPWCAPQWVGETDLANELTDFQRGLW